MLQAQANEADYIFPAFFLTLIFIFSFIGYFYVRHRYFSLNAIIPEVKKGDIQKILGQLFPYYQQLSEKPRRRFERRIVQFIATKQFVPREMDKITPEMKVLIAASFVQLTFGFPSINLIHFKRILIYPDSYYSTINRRYHKGEVNPRHNLIVVSWKNFSEGYISPNDSYNLGLHEMAHALRLENMVRNQEFNFLDPILLRKWDELSKMEMKKLQLGEESFFRKYAGADDFEFFAVAVENFFERPLDFSIKLPDLYKLLVRILKQNPLELYQISA